MPAGEEPDHVGPRFEPSLPPGGMATPDGPSRVPGFVAPSTAPDAPLTTPPTPRPDPDVLARLAPDRREPPRGRHRRLLGLLVVLALLVGAGVLATRRGTPTPDERYLDKLRSYDLDGEFASDEAAIASGRAVCADLEAGAEPEGYERDLVGVQVYCPQYEDAFRVQRTPEDLAQALEAQLRAAGLSREYASTDEAVRTAQGICADLEDDGEAPRGSEADLVGVAVYCPDQQANFQTYRSTTTLGTVTLKVSRLKDAPPIESVDTTCNGANEFAEFHLNTLVILENSAGDQLGVTGLSAGHGSATECTFTFALPVDEGEDAYLVTIGPLDARSYSYEEIEANGVQIELRST